MDIQTVNNIFKDITESLPDFKGYGFGWPSDRQRGRDPESDVESEYPRVFFAVPTVTQDVVRMQDNYRVVLYFDDLQGYDNDGNPVDVTQLGQWSNLQSLAQKWVQEFKSRQLEREADYLGLVSQVNVTLDSFASSQRLVSLQMSFNIVAPSSCGISTALKLARAILSSGGNLIANLTVVKQPTANLVASGTVSANLEGGRVVLYAEANLTADLSLTAIGKMARNIVANISAGGTVDSASQLSLPALAELAAMSSVESAGQIAKISEAILSATATLSALAESQAQGVSYASALLTAQGNISAALSISKQLIADLNAGGNLQAAGLVARMASAALEANAQLLAIAQSVKVAQADLTAVAETQLDAVVSRAVTAQLNAIAETDLNAIISRALSASMSATANTSVTAVLANQCVALLSASATLSATVKRAKLPAFARNAAATISATGTVVTPSVSDPYWANVTLLLRGNSSPITDEKAGTTFSTTGTTPTINTSIKKFGAGSMSFAGNGYIYNTTADDTFDNFGTDAFTIEMWVRFNSVAATQVVSAIITSGGDSTGGFLLYINTNGNLRLFGRAVSQNINTSVAINTWYHIAIVRSGNTWYLFKDGVSQGTFSETGTVNTTSTLPWVLGGYGAGTAYLNGYIDDYRITKGIARYTSNFTPPTAEFPNS